MEGSEVLNHDSSLKHGVPNARFADLTDPFSLLRMQKKGRVTKLCEGYVQVKKRVQLDKLNPQTSTEVSRYGVLSPEVGKVGGRCVAFRSFFR